MGRRGRDRMGVRFTIIYAISTYHHWSCEFESCSWRSVLDTTLCDKFVSGLWWFSIDTAPFSSTNKTGRHDITESGVKYHDT